VDHIHTLTQRERSESRLHRAPLYSMLQQAPVPSAPHPRSLRRRVPADSSCALGRASSPFSPLPPLLLVEFKLDAGLLGLCLESLLKVLAEDDVSVLAHGLHAGLLAHGGNVGAAQLLWPRHKVL
jgi:hypothetical protein